MIKYEIPEILKEHEAIIMENTRYSNEITFKIEETKPWDSKLGGCPYLECIEDYPLDNEGKAMAFLAQINLSDLKNLNELPSKGLLQFFITNDDMYGLDSPIIVNYIENYKESEEDLVRENPYENEYEERLPFSNNGKMYFELREMPISSSLDKFDELFEDNLSPEQYNRLQDDCYACDSRVGGYPYFVQNNYGFEENDFLLLQLDIDDTCGIMFGDSGNCTFSISKEDLRNRDFSKVVYDWQCC